MSFSSQGEVGQTSNVKHSAVFLEKKMDNLFSTQKLRMEVTNQ